MRKVIVIGSPGSGKSVFSRALHAITALPLVHLDNLYWNDDRTIVLRELFLQRLNEAMAGERWILDGNFSSTMEMRMAAADTIFFLDYPPEICLAGIRARQGQKRPDIPWIEESDDEEFLEYVRHFPETNRPKILHRLNLFPDKTVITFHTRDEAEQYLNILRREEISPC